MIASVAVGLTLAVSAANCHAKRILAREIAALKAEGRPTTLEELLGKREPSPPSDDITTMLGAIESDLESCRPTLNRLYDASLSALKKDTTPSANVVQSIDQYLAEKADLLSKVRGMAKPRPLDCKIILQPSDDLATMMQPCWTPLLVSSLMLRLDAIRCAAKQDGDGALASASALLSLSSSLYRTPLPRALRVSQTLEEGVFEATRVAIASSEPSDESLRRLQLELAPLVDDLYPLVLTEDARRVEGLLYFNNLRYARSTPGLESSPHRIGRWLCGVFRFYPDMNAVQYLRAEKPRRQIRNVTLKDYLLNSETARFNLERLYEYSAYPLAGDYGTPYALFLDEEGYVATRTTARIAIVALAAIRYHRSRSHWPASLNELASGWDVPAKALADLYNDDHLLKYRIEGSTCVIDSVGEEQTRDGGAVGQYYVWEKHGRVFTMRLNAPSSQPANTKPAEGTNP